MRGAVAFARRGSRTRWSIACWAIGVACIAATAIAQPAPPLDPPRGDVRLVVFGDFNGPYGSLDYPAAVARTVAAIVDVWRPDLVLLPGDLVAGQSGALPDDRFPAMWAAFDLAVAAPLREAGIAYAATLGNHDASKLRDAEGGFAFAREREAAAAYWRDPGHLVGLELVDADDRPFAWSFRLGPLFVAVLDASGPVIDEAERAWLRATLDSPPARTATLRWVMGHLPLLGIAEGRDREGEVLWRAEALRDLMREAGVDTYVSGHQAAFYAGRWGGLELLFAGGVGGRRLLGTAAPPRSVVNLVDIGFEPLDVRITAFDPAGPTRVADPEVPAAVDGWGGAVTRSPRWID
ncbi:MAG: metallophosphoesterase [Trueperaceae bacterium]|nr:metallophosphoesterase [Trueperaceae bacterium]